MGEATIALTQFQLDKKQELLISLEDKGAKDLDEYLGQIGLSLKLQTKEGADRSSSIVSHISSTGSTSGHHHQHQRVGSDNMTKRNKSTPWNAVVNVVLIEGRDLLAMDLDGASDPYCKFRYASLTLIHNRTEKFRFTLLMNYKFSAQRFSAQVNN